MKILITNHHLQEYTGSEISTFTLAKYLKKTNNEVYVYSKYILPSFIKQFVDIDIPVINNIEDIKDESFDIIHVQHNICAYEVRYYFPNIPIVMWIHGIIPFLERPPIFELNISKFFVNNKEGFDYVKKMGVPKNKIIIIRNIIDSDFFYKKNNLNKKIKKALIISNKITKDKEEMLKNVLEKLKIKYNFIGKNYKIIRNCELGKYINNVDIVFTVALGAMETMLCGRIPILYDYNYQPYDDGIVTEKNFEKLMEYNFSGRATKKIFNEKTLEKEILKYNAKDGDLLMKKAIYYYDAKHKIGNFIKIYKNVIKNFKTKKIDKKNENILYNLINIISITKHYSYYNTYLGMSSQIEEQKNIIEKFQSSKTYKIWQMFNRLKIKILDKK